MSTYRNYRRRDRRRCGAAPEPIAKDEIWRALESLQRWVEARDYRGYEPFDGLSSWARAFTLRNQLAERILQQAIRQCPINLRPFFGSSPAGLHQGSWLYGLGLPGLI